MLRVQRKRERPWGNQMGLRLRLRAISVRKLAAREQFSPVWSHDEYEYRDP